MKHTVRLAVERLQQRLSKLDEEFKTYHLGMVDLLEKEKDLESEQAALGNHDNRVIDLLGCLQHLATPGGGEEKHKRDPTWNLQRRLLRLEGNVRKDSSAVSAITDEAEVDQCLLEQYYEQQNDFKLDLYNTD